MRTLCYYITILIAQTPLLFAETLEIVKLYLPISFKGSETVYTNAEGENVDYRVLPTPYAVAGAMPEELILTLALPYKIPSLAARYTTEEVNLFTLNKAKIDLASPSEGKMDILISLPSDHETTIPAGELFSLFVESLRNTLHDYYRGDDITTAFKIKMTHKENTWDSSFKL